jgi:hypothetical protein
VVVPADILNDLGVCVKRNQRVDGVRELVLLINVPDVDFAVITAGEEESALKWVPVKAVAFSGMSEENHLGLHFICCWADSVFEVVEDVNITGGGLGRDDPVRLGHVSGFVYLTLVIDLQFDLDALVFGNANRALGRCSLSSFTFLSSCILLLCFIQTLSIFSCVFG